MRNHEIALVRSIASHDGAKYPASLYLRYFSLVPAAIVVAALYFGRPVLLPLAVGVLFAFALAPLVGRLRQIGAGRILSVLIAAVLAIGVTTAIGVYITTRTIELAGELPRYQTNLIEKIRSIRGSTMDGGAVERASNLLKTLRDQLVAKGKAPARTLAVRPQARAPRPGANPAGRRPSRFEFAGALVWPLLEFAAGRRASSIIFVIFILLYKEDIRDRFIRLAGGQRHPEDDAAAGRGRRAARPLSSHADGDQRRVRLPDRRGLVAHRDTQSRRCGDWRRSSFDSSPMPACRWPRFCR